MKVIVSHDVDHLYARDHWLRDLYFPKLWFRETKNLIRRQITFGEWIKRCLSCFSWKLNNIPEVLAFDRENGVPSTFFFGMNQGMSMSYKPDEAAAMIEYVNRNGFSAGVHGIAYNEEGMIRQERSAFQKVAGKPAAGIRMHYVRNDENTLALLEKAGYSYDSSVFDKQKGYTIQAPYRQGTIWEFPVGLMDSYLGLDLGKMKSATLEYMKMAEKSGIRYFTVLFHDVYYRDTYKAYKAWYEWLITYIGQNAGYSFISFDDAVRELSMEEKR